MSKTILFNSKTFVVAFVLPATATQEDYDVACSTIKNPAVDSLDNLKLGELVAIHNKLTGSDIKKFSDKATAIERVEADLAAAGVPEYAAGATPDKAKIEKVAKPTGNLGAGVARSWADPAVRAKRSQRHGVKCDGVEYSSVRAAFLAQRLDLKTHQKLRLTLKSDPGKSVRHLDHIWKIYER